MDIYLRRDCRELRDVVFRLLKHSCDNPDYCFASISQRLSQNHFRLSPDIECDLCDELSKFGAECGIKWYGADYYVFDGTIYVPVAEMLISDAFRFFMSEIGMKIAEKKRISLFKNEFLPSIKINARLKPRLDIVAFSNGVLDLTDFSFHAPSPEYHVLHMNSYPYKEKADCQKWKKFLREVLPDKTSRVILQMFLGLGLIERGTVFNPYENKDSAKVELCLILLGSGANGKSVIYQTAMGLFGTDRISGVDYDELTSPGDEGMRSRRLLRDAIFNWSSDSDATTFGRKRTGVFKRIVSGEPVLDRGIGENVSQNFHLPYLIFNLNELPYPNDTSLGFIRRLQFITFDVTIPPEKQNKALAAELVSEYPGIFNWVVRGCKELKRKRFVFPSSEGNRRQMLLAQLKVNPTLAWVNAYGARPEKNASNEIASKMRSDDIAESVKRFCEDNDVDCPSVISIGRTLNAFGFKRKKMAWGKEYDMYGVDKEYIMRPFVIQHEEYRVGYKVDSASYIGEDD